MNAAQGLTHRFANAGVGPHEASVATYASIYRSLQAQSASLAYVDTFMVLFVGSAIMIVLAFFLKKKLGKMYEDAIGLPQNLQKAVGWYRTAFQEGNPDGAMNLGRIYEKGIGVNQDLNQAAFWYGIAAKAGNQEAKERLADLRSK